MHHQIARFLTDQIVVDNRHVQHQEAHKRAEVNQPAEVVDIAVEPERLC